MPNFQSIANIKENEPLICDTTAGHIVAHTQHSYNLSAIYVALCNIQNSYFRLEFVKSVWVHNLKSHQFKGPDGWNFLVLGKLYLGCG